MKLSFAMVLLIGLVMPCSGVVSPGPFTLPFDSSKGVRVLSHYDLGNYGRLRDWTAWSGTAYQVGHAYEGHTGTEYYLRVGTEIRSAQNGIVDSFVDGIPLGDHSTPNGNYVRIRDKSNTWSSLYSHLSPTVVDNVSKGSVIQSGQKIGDSGDTGNLEIGNLYFQTAKYGNSGCPYYNGWWSDGNMGCTFMKITVDGLYVRSGPDPTFSPMTVVGLNSIFVSTETSDFWRRIYIPEPMGRTGWASRYYATTVAMVTEILVVNSPTGLNVHSNPSEEDIVVTTISEGQRYVAQSKSIVGVTPWYEIYLPGSPNKTGWVKGDNLVVYNEKEDIK